ncbi:hypothetical protein BpHYR1_025140 [Brachionus plicatilis]|uniref:Uncharacterized protein n=1 Tax=Brachionus plicatilis TaxID=10195 RepID=A0A3M7RRU7_BRAPC|nr:hypothetical protein BpHYR1_025140 [Brachionus plicatilis]
MNSALFCGTTRFKKNTLWNAMDNDGIRVALSINVNGPASSVRGHKRRIERQFFCESYSTELEQLTETNTEEAVVEAASGGCRNNKRVIEKKL